MNASELLESRPVQSITGAALILCLLRRNGTPNRAAVHLLIRKGKLALVDPTQPITRWTVSSAELRRYINAGPRTGADVIPLRSVS